MRGGGFLQKLDSLLQDALAGNDIGGIARNEQAFEIRKKAFNPVGQFLPVHLRHYNVGDEQMDLTGVILSLADGLGRGGGRKDLVAHAFEQGAVEVENHRVILHQQNRFRAARQGRLPLLNGRGRSRVPVPGQIDLECGAAAQLAMDIDEAFILLDDPVNRGQAQNRFPGRWYSW